MHSAPRDLTVISNLFPILKFAFRAFRAQQSSSFKKLLNPLISRTVASSQSQLESPSNNHHSTESTRFEETSDRHQAAVSSLWPPEMCPRFEEFEFCYVCAKYIKREHDRKPITSELEEMYQDIYNEEMNLSLLDSPESICAECESSFRNFVTGK